MEGKPHPERAEEAEEGEEDADHDHVGTADRAQALLQVPDRTRGSAAGYASQQRTARAAMHTASARQGSVARNTSLPASERGFPRGSTPKERQEPGGDRERVEHRSALGSAEDLISPAGPGSRADGERRRAARGSARRRKPGNRARSPGVGNSEKPRQRWLRGSALSQSRGTAE